MKSILLAVALAASALPAHANRVAERKCLADTVYHEARGETHSGQLAVAETIMNRVRSSAFPKTICGVTRQKGQFAPNGRISERKAYAAARKVAEMAIQGRTGNIAGGATYFHTPAVSPGWARSFTRTGRIGNHIFYRP